MTLRLTTCVVDLRARRLVRSDGSEVALTSREADLLAYLAARPGRDVSMEELHREVWGFSPQVLSRAAFHTCRRLRLKIEADPASPRHLLAVHGVGLRFEPADRPASARPEWSVADTPFVGREDTLRSLTPLLAPGALLVLVGPGGMGKTRTARELGGRSPARGPAWWVDLQAARTLHDVVSAVAGVIGLDPSADPGTRVGERLAGSGDALVVLDNFEQLVHVADDTIGRWRAAAPRVGWVVTSRSRLGLRGEAVVELGPMATADGVALMVDRIRARRAGWSPTEDQGAALAEIVTRLEGLPLALELTAARLASVPDVDAVLAEVCARPGAGLDGTLDASWSLLGPWERDAMAALSVFRGSFDAAAAEAVVGADRPGAPPTAEILRTLVACSLVLELASAGPGLETRYTTYLAIRDHAGRRLAESDADLDALHARHVRHFATRGSVAFLGAMWQRPELQHRTRLELDDVWEALDRALRLGLTTEAARCAFLIADLAQVLGPFDAALPALDRVCGLPLEGEDAVRLDGHRGALLRRLGRRPEAQVALERARDGARRLGLRTNEGRSGLVLGGLRFDLGDLAGAVTEFDAALAALEGAGDEDLVAMGRTLRGAVLTDLGRPEEAAADLVAALARFRRSGHRVFEGVTLSNLGTAHRRLGRPDDGERCYREALVVHRELRNRASYAIVLCNVADMATERGDHETARKTLEEALEVAMEAGNRSLMTQIEGFLASTP